MFNNKGAATTFAILTMSGLLGFGGLKSCSSVTGPKFNVGDCVTRADKEHWEKELDNSTFRIDEVGASKYRTTWFLDNTGKSYSNDSREIDVTDRLYNKIECPNELKGY